MLEGYNSEGENAAYISAMMTRCEEKEKTHKRRRRICGGEGGLKDEIAWDSPGKKRELNKQNETENMENGLKQRDVTVT